MVLKTREKLIDVARQLFARKGIENTTMNDIATASDKGRRTIYTYFKTKHEIYNAVIERESDSIVRHLKDIASASGLTPTQTLEQFLLAQFNQLPSEPQGRSEILIWSFSRDSKRSERLRTLVWQKEVEILQTILDAGIRSGEFNASRAQALPEIVFMLLRSCHINTRRNAGLTGLSYTQIVNFIVGSIVSDQSYTVQAIDNYHT